MSYYMGDYYRGDPGFFSFLGGIAKKAVGFIPGVGPSLSAGLEAITTRGGSRAAAGMATAITKPGFYSGAAAKVGAHIRGAVLKHPVLSGAGAAGLLSLGGAAAGVGVEKHLLRGKKRRRMRATNAKALRRALRRAYAFERIAMRTIKLVHPRKHGRFGGFKKPKKRVC